MRSKASPYVMLAWMTVVGCSEQQPSIPASRPIRGDVRTAVTAAVRNQIDANGRFALPVTTATPIRQDQARTLATAYLQTFGRYLRPAFEKERGEKIDLSDLTARPRVYLAEAPYRIEGEVTKATRNAYSDYYVVQFEDHLRRPVMSVAVSTVADDVSVENGRLRLPKSHGNEFHAVGIPVSNVDGLPIAPEAAAVLANANTGALVASTPRLVQEGLTALHVRGAPERSLWQLTLDRSVTIRSARTGLSSSVRELFIDSRGEFFARQSNQPEFLPAYNLALRNQTNKPIPSTARLHRIAEMPLEFDAVSVGGDR